MVTAAIPCCLVSCGTFYDKHSLSSMDAFRLRQVIGSLHQRSQLLLSRLMSVQYEPVICAGAGLLSDVGIQQSAHIVADELSGVPMVLSAMLHKPTASCACAWCATSIPQWEVSLLDT